MERCSCSFGCQLAGASGFWRRSRAQQLTPANLCGFQHALDFYLHKWITSNLARLFIASTPAPRSQDDQTRLDASSPLNWAIETHRMFHLMTQRTQHFSFVCWFALWFRLPASFFYIYFLFIFFCSRPVIGPFNAFNAGQSENCHFHFIQMRCFKWFVCIAVSSISRTQSQSQVSDDRPLNAIQKKKNHFKR